MSAKTTPHFGLPIPDLGEVGWGQKLLDWFHEAERTLGCNVNLILNADDGHGVGQKYGLAALVDEATVVKADPGAGRWGRAILQASMIDGAEVLTRLLGVSRVLGVADDAALGDTIYHAASGATMTADPDEAVRDAGDWLEFLPLGYAFDGGDAAAVVTTMPLQVCPIQLSGAGVAYKPGLSDPAGTWTTVFDAGPAMQITFDSGGQSIDLLLPFAIPGDYDRWLDKSGGSFWAFRSWVRTSGASVDALSVIDSGGTEHALTLSPVSPAAYAALDVAQSDALDLGGSFDPSGTCYLRLRAAGGAGQWARVRPHALMQYFPSVAWQ